MNKKTIKFEEMLLEFMRRNVRGKDNYVYIHPKELDSIIGELSERVYPETINLLDTLMSYNPNEDSLWMYPDSADHDSWEIDSVCRYVVYDESLNAFTLTKDSINNFN